MGRVLPILFNTEMVRAILDGRKTVTRRCVRYKYSNTEMKMHNDKYGTRLIEIQKDVEGETHGKNPDGSTWRKLLGYIEPKPPCQPGDILYVRETWQYLNELDGNEQVIDGTGWYYYAATDTLPDGVYIDSMGRTHEHIPWHPSIHMPKEAARIWLKVTDVRVERLQKIKPEQLQREGMKIQYLPSELKGQFNKLGAIFEVEEKKREFSKIWDSTLKKSSLERYGWDANPWVWVIEFEQCGKPEGEV